MDPSQLTTDRAQMRTVDLCLSKERSTALVVHTWEELKVPIPELSLQRHISQRPLLHRAGPTGVMTAAQSKKTLLACRFSVAALNREGGKKVAKSEFNKSSSETIFINIKRFKYIGLNSVIF